MDDLKLYGQNEKQIDTLVNTVQIFSEDIGMEFWISKCATLIMKRGIISKNEGIQLTNDEFIKNMDERERKLEHYKPEILLVRKQTGEYYIIDIACPFDTRVKERKQE